MSRPWHPTPPEIRVLYFCVIAWCALMTCSSASDSSSLGCVPDSQINHCYTFHEGPENWEDAEGVCARDGRILAILDSSQKDVLVSELIKTQGGALDAESPGYRAWIGGRSASEAKWAWSNGSPFEDKKHQDWIKFNSDPKPYQACAAVDYVPSQTDDTKAVQLTSRHCRTPLHFICQKPVTSTQDSPGERNDTSCTLPPYSGTLVNHTCYVVYGNDPDNFLQGWRKAQRSCRLLGGDLATVETLPPGAVRAVLGGQEGMYWAGLTRQHWAWVDKLNSGAVNFTRWLPDPQVVLEVLDCMAAGVYPPSKYGWTDENCGGKLPYICEQRIPITTPAPNTTRGPAGTKGNLTEAGKRDDDDDEGGSEGTLRDWANVIIPCAMISIIALAAILSVFCYFRQKRKDYNVEK